MRLLVLIPAYRLADGIADLLGRVREVVPDADVLVVDDGSEDGTAARAESVPGVRVISHPRNRGKGAALRTGFAVAMEEGHDWVLTIDGDGQHPPESIPRFLEAAGGGSDLIVGSRRGDHSSMPKMRRLSNRLSSWLASQAAGVPLPDSQSGYRLIRTDILRKVPLTTDGYEMETELLIGAARAGFRITDVPIPTCYGEETSHIQVGRDIVRFLGVLRRSREKKR
jgi:glycosyltransferase involved in cell wall biosynthesis